MFRVLGPTGCWEWTGHTRKASGYGEVSWGLDERRVHRIAYIALVGPIPDGLILLHGCDNPPCFNPDHLSLGTLIDNADDMIAKRRNAFGEKSPHAKLTEDQVREIRAMAGQMPQRLIADRFGIKQMQVSRIIRGERWRHVAAAQPQSL